MIKSPAGLNTSQGFFYVQNLTNKNHRILLERKKAMNKIIPYIKLIHRTLPNAPLCTVQINLTTNCGGLNCMTCKRSTWPFFQISCEKIQYLFRCLNAMCVETAYITGGDPLLYPYLFDVLERFRGDVKIGMVTTAAFKVYPIEFWERLYENVEWCRITLDAVSDSVYEKIKGKNLLNNVIDNCEHISKLQLPKEKVRINTLEIKGLNEEEIPLIIYQADQWGFDFRLHQVHTFPEFRSNKDDIAPQLCPTTQIHCMIDADGEVFPCSDIARENGFFKDRKMEHSYGNINQHSISNIWKFGADKRFLLYSKRCEECKWCSPRANESNKIYSEFVTNDRGIFL